ncbi:MAG TPA: PAS domain-containing protein [Bacteroidales bacterium]|nr:PAS domain-containing protein [Bacteroidales bacterium]
MSEIMENRNDKLNNLFDFAHRLIDGENGKMLIETYQQSINTVNAVDAMQVFDRLLQEGYQVEKVKANVGKIINVFFKALSTDHWTKPDEGHFMYYLMLENREVEKLIADIRPYIKMFLKSDTFEAHESLQKLRDFISKVKEYELHYIKKENILFPYLEKTFTQHRCLQLMWSFHDDFRRSVKALELLLQPARPDVNAVNTELGKLFFVIMPIIFREEQIVFPVAIRAIPHKIWNEMLEQSKEIGWCYGVTPKYSGRTSGKEVFNGLVNLGSGFLKPEQLILLLNNLPVDITFVDENDEVCYFSEAKDRIFPRSKAIIGRKVQNCHPPESVHVVTQIVEAFRNGTKDHADFWIQMKNHFIYIRYFAMRNENGQYKGTVEVSQDVTDIRALQGQQRLLDWK